MASLPVDASADARRKAELPLTSVNLPGMSVELPVGWGSTSQTIPPIAGDYATGSITEAGAVSYYVDWAINARLDRDDQRRLAEKVATAQIAALRVTRSRAISMGESPGYLFELAAKQNRFQAFVTIGECDNRRVLVMASGVSRDLARTNERMLASFRCKPDQSQVRDVVVVDALDGWRLSVSSKPGSLSLVNGDLFVKVASIPGITARDAWQAQLTADLSRNGFTASGPSRRTPEDKVLWTGVLAGKNGTRPSAVVAWLCPDEPRLGWAMVLSLRDGANLDPGIALARTGRCLKPGEAPPVYPSRK